MTNEQTTEEAFTKRRIDLSYTQEKQIEQQQKEIGNQQSRIFDLETKNDDWCVGYTEQKAKLDLMEKETEDMCGQLNVVCNTFGIDVETTYAEAFKTKLDRIREIIRQLDCTCFDSCIKCEALAELKESDQS